MRPLALIVFLFVLSGCPQDTANDLNSNSLPLAADKNIRHHLVVVGRYENLVRARGFSNAVPKGATVNLRLGNRSRQVVASETGRFDLSIALDMAEFENALLAELTVVTQNDSSTATYCVRNTEEALSQIAGTTIKTGAVPNDLLLFYRNDEPFVFVPASVAAELHLFGPKQTTTVHFFPDTQNSSAYPWSVALSNDDKSAVVSLQGQHKVALIDTVIQKIEGYGEVKKDGKFISFKVNPPIQLRDKLDALRNGHHTNFIDAMAARHPQGVVFVGDEVLVTFTNLLEFAQGKGMPASFGPGVLARFKHGAGSLEFVDALELPCQNPTHLAKDSQGHVWVVCSGVFAHDSNDQMTLSSSAKLLEIGRSGIPEQARLFVSHKIDLGKSFAPGLPAFFEDSIVVGNTIGAEILVIKKNATHLKEGLIIPVTAKKGNSSNLLSTITAFGNLVWITDFQQDRLLVLDMEHLEINPWPFVNGIPVAPKSGNGAFRGPIAAAIRKGEPGIDYTGPDSFLLLSVSAELVPMTMLKLMGPKCVLPSL